MREILFVYEWLIKRFFDISLELIVNRKKVQFFDAERSKQLKFYRYAKKVLDQRSLYNLLLLFIPEPQKEP